MMGVYAIANRVNGKMYVGSAKSIEVRWQQHRNMLRQGKHHSFYLQRAWDRYGEDAFILQVLERVEKASELRAAEQRWMDFLGGSSGNNGYNVHPVAAGGQMPGYTASKEARIKLGTASRGERNNKAKLTEAKVKEICTRYGAGESAQHLAGEYGVSRSTVTQIVRGRVWKHVDVPRYQHNSEATGKWHRADRLTDADVLAIRDRCARKERQGDIAKAYGVSIQTIGNIAQGRRKLTDSTI